MLTRSFGLITARKGSTRLIGKNRKCLAGRPLFRWTLDAALESGVLDHVLVSTDDEYILEECTGIEGVISERRPQELAKENVSSVDVLIHMIPRVYELCGKCEAFCMLQPTSPFRGPEAIQRVMATLMEPGVEFAVGIAPFDSPPFFALRNEKGLHPVNNGALTHITRTQDVPLLYHPAGGIFAGLTEAILRQKHFYGSTSRGVGVDHYAAVDINTPEDFDFADTLAQGLLQRGEL